MPISNGHRLLLNPVQIKDKVSGFFVCVFCGPLHLFGAVSGVRWLVVNVFFPQKSQSNDSFIHLFIHSLHSTLGPSGGQSSPCPSLGQQSAGSPTSATQLSPAPSVVGPPTSSSAAIGAVVFPPASSSAATGPNVSSPGGLMAMAGPPPVGQIGPRPQMGMTPGDMLAGE